MSIFKIPQSGGARHPAVLTINKWLYFDPGIIWEGGSWVFKFTFRYQIRISTSKSRKISIFKIHTSGGAWHPAVLTIKKWVYFDPKIIWDIGTCFFEVIFQRKIRISKSKSSKIKILKIHLWAGVWPDTLIACRTDHEEMSIFWS